MSIGTRLKSERTRLEMSQEAFSKAAGVSKRALIEWEKGATFPSAGVLEALSGIGVDILYVVTGRREGAAQGMSQASANSLLASVEEMLEAGTSPPDDVADELVAIAEDPTLDDKIRARADLAIRFFHEGKPAGAAAEARQNDRAVRQQREMRRAETIVSDAAAAAGWEPPSKLRGHLVNLVRLHRVSSDTISVLLYDLARLSDASDR